VTICKCATYLYIAQITFRAVPAMPHLILYQYYTCVEAVRVLMRWLVHTAGEPAWNIVRVATKSHATVAA
jgi:hypothetical protein